MYLHPQHCPPQALLTPCLQACLTELACLSLQNGLADKIERSRKQIKERKNRSKKIRGVKKNAGQCSLLACVPDIALCQHYIVAQVCKAAYIYHRMAIWHSTQCLGPQMCLLPVLQWLARSEEVVSGYFDQQTCPSCNDLVALTVSSERCTSL